ncbi:MAG: polysaccharide biosynthesis C-terminal domain-containing protein [Flavobacteriales bacterium]|nr:polysaccharide biosynthesis C-terminal domain-containing protein [Flavobacteriales bacterium]
MLSESHSRSKELLNNVLGSGLYKGINILFSLLIVRFSIQIMGEERYGIWLALLSFFTWFSAFEVGVSNSLRNSITHLFSENKFEQIKQLIHKGYKTLFILYFGLISILLILSSQSEFSQLILPEVGNFESFNVTFQWCLVLYFAHFVLFFLHNALLATHHTKYIYLIVAIQNALLLLGLVFCYYWNYTPSLMLFCIWFSSLPLFIWLFSSVYFYNTSFQQFGPKLSEIFDKKVKAFQGLNKNFFIIQFCTLILFSTDNIIIVNYIGSYEVTVYNVTFKYFNLLIILFNLVLLPYWASFTDAYGKGDKVWILRHMKKLMRFSLGIGLLGIVMLIFSPWALKAWIGKELTISLDLLLFMLLSILLTAWNSIFAYFLNSVSRTQLQTKLLVFAALINIPLSIYLIQGYDAAGVIMATCISLFPQAIFLPIEYRSVIQKMSNKDGV